MQDPAENRAEVGKLAVLMSQGPAYERMEATKEVDQALQADPGVAR